MIGERIAFKAPLFDNLKDILIFTKMLNEHIAVDRETSVMESYVFKNYDAKSVQKICLIKTFDRLDNLGSIYIFDEEKQKRIKENTVRDILPLAIHFFEETKLHQIFKYLICSNKLLDDTRYKSSFLYKRQKICLGITSFT